MHLLVVQNVKEFICICIRLVYLESSSLIPHHPPQCFVVTINSASPFILGDVMQWGWVGASESQPESLRGPALGASWILEV